MMKKETLKELIEIEFDRSETIFHFKKNVLRLIDLSYEDKEERFDKISDIPKEKLKRLIPDVPKSQRSQLQEGIPEKPKPPLDKVFREGSGHFCKNCGSTCSKDGWFGSRYCDNKECKNSKFYR
jgi:hypothetical protein